MGMPARLMVKFSPKIGERVAVSGETRYISDHEKNAIETEEGQFNG